MRRLVPRVLAGPSNKKASPEREPEPTPRRIIGRVGGLSVKRQQQLVQFLKEPKSVDAPTRVTPRRPQAPPSGADLVSAEVQRAVKERRLERERVEQAAAQKEAALYRTRKKRLLIVDAYNVMHRRVFHSLLLEAERLWPDWAHHTLARWPKYAAELETADNLERLRAAFLAELIGYSTFSGLQTVVVFDARMRPGLNCSLKTADRERLSVHLSTVFACGADGTADAFIEAEVAGLYATKEADRPDVWVATSDNLLGTMCRGAGASVYTAETLVKHVVESDKAAKETVRKSAAKWTAQGGQRVLGHVDGVVQNKLLALRATLNEQAKRRA